MKKPASILTLLRQDHRPLKAAIRVLKSGSATAANKIKTLSRFLIDLKLHSKSEERSLYQATIEQDDVRTHVLEGFEEHALADLLTAQLERAVFEKNWSDEVAAKAKVLAELVAHHLREEEEVMLPAMAEAYSDEDLREMGRIYASVYEELKEELKTASRGERGNPARGLKVLQHQFQIGV